MAALAFVGGVVLGAVVAAAVPAAQPSPRPDYHFVPAADAGGMTL